MEAAAGEVEGALAAVPLGDRRNEVGEAAGLEAGVDGLTAQAIEAISDVVEEEGPRGLLLHEQRERERRHVDAALDAHAELHRRVDALAERGGEVGGDRLALLQAYALVGEAAEGVADGDGTCRAVRLAERDEARVAQPLREALVEGTRVDAADQGEQRITASVAVDGDQVLEEHKRRPLPSALGRAAREDLVEALLISFEGGTDDRRHWHVAVGVEASEVLRGLRLGGVEEGGGAAGGGGLAEVAGVEMVEHSAEDLGRLDAARIGGLLQRGQRVGGSVAGWSLVRARLSGRVALGLSLGRRPLQAAELGPHRLKLSVASRFDAGADGLLVWPLASPGEAERAEERHCGELGSEHALFLREVLGGKAVPVLEQLGVRVLQLPRSRALGKLHVELEHLLEADTLQP